MKLNDLTAVPGSRKERKRLGRGLGSGQGKTAGKGSKGQKARSGGHIRPGFEGGQMPLQRRLPKRGFVNNFAEQVQTVNVGSLEKFSDGAEVDAKALAEAGIAKLSEKSIKVLGNGKLTKKLTVKANAFSASAKEKIEAAGGKAEVI